MVRERFIKGTDFQVTDTPIIKDHAKFSSRGDEEVHRRIRGYIKISEIRLWL